MITAKEIDPQRSFSESCREESDRRRCGNPITSFLPS
jgi:hypothetical protein